MDIQAASFTDIKASADYLGNGAIEINKYESEIVDIVRRESVFLQRVDRRPASGHPHRYFEQTAVASAGFTDPRTISPSTSGPTRVERSAMIKALTAQTNFSLFDLDVTRQQGQFAYTEARDIEDIVKSIVILQAANVYNGSDTSLTTPTTTQYMGILSQITQQATIAAGASIIDGIKAQVALMAANTTYVPRPSAVYVNPVLGDYLDREAKASNLTFDKMEVVAGVQVNAIQTQAGKLPIIADPFLPTTAASTAAFGFSATPSTAKGYYAVIVMESMIEMPVVHGGDGNLNPRLFQMGLVNDLQHKYVAVQFDSIIAKGPSYAHSVVQILRP